MDEIYLDRGKVDSRPWEQEELEKLKELNPTAPHTEVLKAIPSILE
jgi:hypothetical protein